MTTIPHSFAETYGTLNPDIKAATLGQVLHLNQFLFENDLPPVYVRSDGGQAMMVCTLCQMYLCGCCVPCQIIIPLNKK